MSKDDFYMRVPLESLYWYVESKNWHPYRSFFKSTMVNYKGKRYKRHKEGKRYEKAAKLIRKAVKYLPPEFVVEVKPERSNENAE